MRLRRLLHHGYGRSRPAEGRHIATKASRQASRGRPWSWITGRPRLTDGLVVAFNLLAGTIAIAGSYRFRAISVAAVLVVMVEAVPLWWRRRYPVPILVLIVCAEVARWALGFSSEPSGPALVFAVYAVSLYDRTPARLIVGGAAIFLMVFAVSLLLLGRFPESRTLIPGGALSLVAWVIGDYIRSRRQKKGCASPASCMTSSRTT